MYVRVECGVAWRYRLDDSQLQDLPLRCDGGSHRGNRTPERIRTDVGNHDWSHVRRCLYAEQPPQLRTWVIRASARAARASSC